jgi:hypothetical protein
MNFCSRRLGIACLIAMSGVLVCLGAEQARTVAAAARWRQHDNQRPRPPAVEPAETSIAAKPPKDAIVLFDGSNLDAWKSTYGGPAKWKLADGVMEIAPGTGPIETKGKYGDIQLHVEWASPKPPGGVGQDRGNSGIFLMDQFEIQVLDSYKAETYADGQAGAIYGQFPPLFNASRPPGEWQTYDIAFRRPRFDASGKLLERARVTLFHNGILVQNNEEPIGPTSWLRELPYTDHGDRGVISLQDHSHPVRFRNIWLRELPERAAPPAETRPPTVTLTQEILDQYAGKYQLTEKADGVKATIVRDGGHLVITFPFRPQPLVLEPISETEFDMPHTDGHFTFQKDSQGHVTGVLFRIGDGKRELKKLAP